MMMDDQPESMSHESNEENSGREVVDLNWNVQMINKDVSDDILINLKLCVIHFKISLA